ISKEHLIGPAAERTQPGQPKKEPFLPFIDKTPRYPACDGDDDIPHETLGNGIIFNSAVQGRASLKRVSTIEQHHTSRLAVDQNANVAVLRQLVKPIKYIV